MAFADLWDRFFKALLLFLFLTFAWLGLADRALAYAPAGFLVATGGAGAYLAAAVLRLRAADAPSRTSGR